MDELKEKYAQKKNEIKEKYADVITRISNARGVDVGVALDMLLAICRGGNYADVIDPTDNVADVVNGGEVISFDLDELNADYFELASISEQIAKMSGLID